MPTPDGMEALRELVIAAWPGAASWPGGVWTVWQRELAIYTDEEILDAARSVARRGDPWPPGWGVIFRAASPAHHRRLSRAAERAWMEEDEMPTSDRP